jgi:hypothetical protein
MKQSGKIQDPKLQTGSYSTFSVKIFASCIMSYCFHSSCTTVRSITQNYIAVGSIGELRIFEARGEQQKLRTLEKLQLFM